MRESELAQLDDTYRQEAEMMLAVDQMPANILETLRHVGQLQNTYIIFSADQGFHMGEYRLARMKLTPYTGSTQIPIIVRGPGVPARTTLDGLALNTDLVPTIADIAGVTPPSFVDGRSLKPL